MSIPASIEQYLMRQDRDGRREFIVGSCDGIDQVVVIPALAEKEALFETLKRLSANQPLELCRTLVICVINNREKDFADLKDIENNRQTMTLLRSLIHGDVHAAGTPAGVIEQQSRQIGSSGIRLACLDASSRGMEMPEKNGGVGLARKLGLDRALSLFDYQSPARKLLFNLDADTWVEPCYLSAVRHFFDNQKIHAAVVGFSHRSETDPVLEAAICCYEIFLRYYILGLRFAGSPYDFHAIGSTMVCTPESYAAVYGMNRREAAEDFYFLNKLNKLGPVAGIHTTIVYPSARPSRRVPFGTGQRMIRFLEGRQNEYLLYDPEVFMILKRWLETMAGGGRREVQDILTMAARIHPLLGSFLEMNRFHEVWPRIRRNHREPDALAKQFHVWFDGFKTLKLIHYLTEKGFPKRDMFSALKDILDMMNIHCPIAMSEKTRSNLDEQMQILNLLRSFNNHNISLT
ncbi:MAG: glycosyltransferase family A protein [Pseudomonadota bacterium]